jgi:peptidoglycan/xylan/chitin deacetylase (PgdA/CDA1 family)
MSCTSINSDIPMSLSFGSLPLPSPIRTTATLNSTSNRENHEGKGDSVVCLTFDDGPDPRYTQKILNVLSDYDVKATFFVLGEAAEKYPHLLVNMIEAGHTVGNHTYSHQHPWMISSERAKHEVTRASAVIKDITERVPRWFRPPFGRLRSAMRKQAHAENMATVLWSHSIIDWGPLGTEAGISKRLERIKPDDIVLMHDGKREHNRPDIIIQCLPRYLKSLSERSFVARSLDDLC